MSSTSQSGNFPRGSEWRQWDLHIHTPASFHWNGQKFSEAGNSVADKALIDDMIAALNEAEPEVFAIMDYWTFDGWLALKKRLAEPDCPKLTKKVFPGIELRLAAPTECRLNAHVIFSDEIDDQVLADFRAALTIEIINRPLSDAALIQLARTIGASKLKTTGFEDALVQSDATVALRAGCMNAELNCDSYKSAIAKVHDDLAIGFMPYDTSDGLDEVKWQDHYAYFLGLFRTSPIFESRNHDLRGAFVNEETPGNKRWIEDFQRGLGNVPRLVVSGSDAHRFRGTKGDNDKRGYGDFPSGKKTWIKADPTFRGLQQAIREPAKRSFIGAKPPKLIEIEQNKTFFIDSVRIDRLPGTVNVGDWLHDNSVQLNPDLVAIIGNKGSGKSALADIIGLLGNSRQKLHFSFLKKERFRGRSGDPAKHFVAKMSWCDGTATERNLNEDPPIDKVELVRYIPQGHFEGLCNDHISQKSNAFEKELRSVIFSHTDDKTRLGALDFEQLIEVQEASFRDQLNEARKNLKRINQDIASCEEQLQPEVLSSLEEVLSLRQRQIEEHTKIRPTLEEKPSQELSEEQTKAAGDLEKFKEEELLLTQKQSANSTEEIGVYSKIKAIQNVRERLRLLERSAAQFVQEANEDLALLGLKKEDVFILEIKSESLDKAAKDVDRQREVLAKNAESVAARRSQINQEKPVLHAKLNGPQMRYQQSVTQLEQWQNKLNEINGSSESPDSLKGVEARIAQLKALPEALKTFETKRDALCLEIFDILEDQRKARETLFLPVHNLIQNNTLIRNDYKLQFQATLGCSSDAIATSLFVLVKQNSGEFRGEDESYSAIRRLVEKNDFSTRDGVLSFVKELYGMLQLAAQSNGKTGVGISSVLRKDRSSVEVFDLLFGLAFLEPRYSLLFQDAQIEQLSPGQRGALLLIFYLLVDKGRNPIVLDQPEENLDNETVVNLLVPVLTEAKKKRQIIMVTHNPNLAVVCDAEQVVYSSFDRKNSSKITYEGGSIERPVTNSHVITVLEGTKPAFNNRRNKYH